MRLPKTIFLLSLDDLEDYVHNKAVSGDILMCISNEYGSTKVYGYCCTQENIGKNVKPYWLVLENLCNDREKIDTSSDIQKKILINERKELLNQIKARDEVIDFLLDALEDEHIGSRAVYNKEIFAKWDLQY